MEGVTGGGVHVRKPAEMKFTDLTNAGTHPPEAVRS